MNPDLIKATAERIQSGSDKESVRQELLASGYTEADVESVYQAAQSQIQNTQTVAEPMNESVSVAAVQLPPFGQLILSSIRFVSSRKDFLIAAVLVGIALGLAEILTNEPQLFGLSDPFPGGLLVSLLAMVVGVVHFSIIVYVTVNSSENEGGLTYLQGFSWAKENVISIIWIGILITLIVLAGLTLFIIPGIILGVYASLSYFVFARTHTRGLSAILLSRHLVYGNWLGVWWRQFGIGILSVILVAIIGVSVGLILSGFDVATSSVLAIIVSSILSIFAGMISLRAMSLIFHSLESKIQQSEQALATAPKTKYTILAWVGLVAVPLLGVIFFAFEAFAV